MSFFRLSTGEQPAQSAEGWSNEPEKPIPDDTDVLASIVTARWEESNFSGRYILIEWGIAAPQQHAGRVHKQKLPMFIDDNKKRDKALQAFVAIDMVATGGYLFSLNREPDDSELGRLVGKFAVLKLKVYEMKGDDGNMRTWNWVAKISPRKGGQAAAPTPKPAPAAAPVAQAPVDDDETIPF